MSSAQEKVFNLPELLEAILLYLDTKTLLLSQRVNTTFQATIEDSLRLQQALFFKPVDDPFSFDGDPGQFNACFRYRRFPMTLNGIDVDVRVNEGNWENPGAGASQWAVTYSKVRDDELERERHHQPQASWRRMLVNRVPGNWDIGHFEDNPSIGGWFDVLVDVTETLGEIMQELARVQRKVDEDEEKTCGGKVWGEAENGFLYPGSRDSVTDKVEVYAQPRCYETGDGQVAWEAINVNS